MHHLSNIELALVALILEATIGYPAFVYRAVRHPVTWIGALIDGLEGSLNWSSARGGWSRVLGILAMTVLLAATGGIAFALDRLLSRDWIGASILILAMTSLLAQRSLYDHVGAVATTLAGDGLEASRQAVSMIVGRNPNFLDEAGVARAAIESLAENFSDGIVAPTLWLMIGGLPGGVCYKAANTADSMIGHRTPRYAAFGWAAARLDDLINLPASRLSALFIVLAALVTGASSRGAVTAVWRDANQHGSPNAGWPEAAMAGALGLKLAGPRIYGDTLVEDAFMGNGRRDATATDVTRALRLFRFACVTQWLMLLGSILIWQI